MPYARILEFYDIILALVCQLPVKAISTLANFIAKMQKVWQQLHAKVWQQLHATVSTWPPWVMQYKLDYSYLCDVFQGNYSA
jgi:hypothetical protein